MAPATAVQALEALIDCDARGVRAIVDVVLALDLHRLEALRAEHAVELVFAGHEGEVWELDVRLQVLVEVLGRYDVLDVVLPHLCLRLAIARPYTVPEASGGFHLWRHLQPLREVCQFLAGRFQASHELIQVDVVIGGGELPPALNEVPLEDGLVEALTVESDEDIAFVHPLPDVSQPVMLLVLPLGREQGFLVAHPFGSDAAGPRRLYKLIDAHILLAWLP